ncbi:MAG: NADPH-dependent glutamate synthase [Nitrospina sp.]|jgi:glutamate synthase (NADPH) small chain|nr:NADPH-dependent glutamate synthase [Nitrospina sp.]MBT3507962.1 NADPH-dependent glutamate synthase [Nitrospina sp.]MBT3876489.1 NADPH-dependent glutamate synthase [Nitrospina sp.]MBT4048691.1 NADPH-dependent glutamate synthase [Nitrospina sp.]MBT4556920.1 NADPH-dependent glutamate synthase [Nitrospina sp.]
MAKNEKSKQRYIAPRTRAPEQNPEERSKNFQEVSLGYTPAMAQLEASRCVQCKKPKCVIGCPVRVAIPDFLEQVAKGDFLEAARIVKESNALPAVTGRVCPQEDQCEKHCVIGIKGEPLAIGKLERFVADYEHLHQEVNTIETAPPTGKKIAIIGAGPAGLAAASDLAKLGHEVVIFEALHKPGGVLFYGIPEFRLPKEILEAELDYLKRLGIEIKVNYVIGKIKTLDDLMGEDGFNAIFIGTGAGLPYFLDIPGENLNGVYSANEFLTRINLMHAWEFPVFDTPIHHHKIFAVIGGGNTALDAARTALRLPTTEKVMLIYRRSREELPARLEEVEHAEAEGIEFHYLESPTEIKGANGWVSKIVCQKMELGEPDGSGRKHPRPVENSAFSIKTDAVIIALGSGVNPLIAKSASDLKTDSHGHIELADPNINLTSRPGVFAGGDIVTGAATVISAMGAGKKAAEGIHQYIMSR